MRRRHSHRKAGPHATSCVGTLAPQEAAVCAFVRCVALQPALFLHLFSTRLNLSRIPPRTGRCILARSFQCCRSACLRLHSTDSSLGARRFVHARRLSLLRFAVPFRNVVSFVLVHSSLVQVHVGGRGCAVELLQGAVSVHGLLEMRWISFQDVLEPSCGSSWMAMDVHVVHGDRHRSTSDGFVDARGARTRAHGVVRRVPGASGEGFSRVQGLQQRQDVGVHVAARHVEGRGHEHGAFVVGQLRHVSFFHVQVHVFSFASPRFGADHTSKHVACASWRLATFGAQPQHGACRAHRATPSHVCRVQGTLGGLLRGGMDGCAQPQLQARSRDQPRHVSTHMAWMHGCQATDMWLQPCRWVERKIERSQKMSALHGQDHDPGTRKASRRRNQRTKKGHKKPVLQQQIPCSAHQGGLASVQENLAHGSSKSASFCESRPTNTCRNLASNSPKPAADILLATERGRTHRLDSTKPRIQLLSIFSQHTITTLFSQKMTSYPASCNQPTHLMGLIFIPHIFFSFSCFLGWP